MAPQGFKDENIIILAPGSSLTLVQHGLPESFTPARHRIKSRMFPGPNKGEFEPFKVRAKSPAKPDTNGETNGSVPEDEDIVYEEDTSTDEGAIWPIRKGVIVDWDCFYALMSYAYNIMGSPFHAPILLIAEPAWTPKDHERITQFVFEKIKPPAFTIIDAAQAACYAYGLSTATIVDVGEEKADITAVTDFLVHDIGRSVALPDCGGEAMTQRLMELLRSRGFTREMCEQLKRSPICEILPAGTPLPNAGASQNGISGNPAASASTGADDSGPNQRTTAASSGGAPRRPGDDTEMGMDEHKDEVEENDGVIDVASIVTSGKMTEYLERKEREKVAKVAAKKKGAEASTSAAKPVRLKNAEKEKATFMYEDFALMGALKGSNANSAQIEETRAALDDGRNKPGDTSPVDVNGSSGFIRREISVGVERFQALSESFITELTSAIHRTIMSAPLASKRGELWESMIIVGNGSSVKGFKEALLSSLNSRFLISPSSATIFTSELPSNFSTPIATGTNTPQPPEIRQGQPHGVNPLLHAATTASYQQQPMGGQPHQHLHPQAAAMHHPQPQHHHLPQPQQQQQQQIHHHSSHSQSPTTIKLARLPDYFPEWKEHGHEEAIFLGAQVAAKVIFVVDASSSANLGKAFLLRSEYNEQGPTAIHEYAM